MFPVWTKHAALADGTHCHHRFQLRARGFDGQLNHLARDTDEQVALVLEIVEDRTFGDTGSLRGPSLYFEVRERGRPVDPRAWLAPRAGDILAR